MKMKKSLCVILMFIGMIMFSGCSKKELNYTVSEVDGIKTYYNKNIPSDPNFKISPKEVFTIHGYDENAQDTLRNFINPYDITVDRNGNIYILDNRLSCVKQFDPDGKYLRSIGRKGIGPGEMEMAAHMMILNDTLFVSDVRSSKMSVFDLKGDFIRNFYYGDYEQKYMRPVNSESYICLMESWKTVDEKLHYVNHVNLRNSKFEFVKTIKENIGEYIGDNTNFFDYSTSFCVGQNRIYTAKNSTDDYLINVMDEKGDLLYRIKKDFRKLAMSDEESKHFAQTRKVALLDEVNREYKINFKRAVEPMAMSIEKNGHILVQVPVERNDSNRYDCIVDAFKDGVFINRFKMDVGKAYDFFNADHKRYYFGNRIYYLNREDNCVTVYEY
jgi:hypothetical protein